MRARRWRPLALIAVLVLGGATGALAAAGVFQTGTPVGPYVLAQANAFEGVAVPGSLRLLALRVADPDGGPSWVLRALRTTRGLECVELARLVGGKIGVIGEDGAFADDETLPPALRERIRVLLQLRATRRARSCVHDRHRVRTPGQRSGHRQPVRPLQPTAAVDQVAHGPARAAHTSPARSRLPVGLAARRLLRDARPRRQKHHLHDGRQHAHRTHRRPRRRLPRRPRRQRQPAGPNQAAPRSQTPRPTRYAPSLPHRRPGRLGLPPPVPLAQQRAANLALPARATLQGALPNSRGNWRAGEIGQPGPTGPHARAAALKITQSSTHGPRASALRTKTSCAPLRPLPKESDTPRMKRSEFRAPRWQHRSPCAYRRRNRSARTGSRRSRRAERSCPPDSNHSPPTSLSATPS